MPPPLVSVVIPCYNPAHFLDEAVASVRAQTCRPIEIILVDDGTDQPEALRLLDSLAGGVDRFVRQGNQGLAAARNTGFRAATGEYLLPLDADDRLAPSFISECLAAFEAHPEAAFVYPDYRVFGDTAYTERLGDYNLFRLLDRNSLIYASLIRRADWELAGGYDASMRLGYEDWDFWLRLAERGRFGHHLPQVLFEYRKHGRSLLTLAREHHAEIVEKIKGNHPKLYSREGRARIKAQWAPAVCILDSQAGAAQTIEDVQWLPAAEPQRVLTQSAAEAFLLPGAGAILDTHSAELCALAVWGGHSVIKLPDGALCASRKALVGADDLGELAAATVKKPASSSSSFQAPWPSQWERIHQNLVNAELLSIHSWLRHPLRSFSRLIPLRAKERVNRAAGRAVFDLSFYLRFQPQSVLAAGELVEPLRYMPRPAERHRIALVTPHLGPGGAESVLLEAAAAIDRRESEIFVIATQSQDSSWRPRWEQAADHVYDLAALIPPERMVAAVYSLSLNWEFHTLLIQNSLAAYSAIPFLRRDQPGLRIIDWIHAVDAAWDFVGATSAVASQIDLRVAISEAGRRRMLETGVPEEKIRLIRNGIDLQRFTAAPLDDSGRAKKILFAGRLDPIKRPLLLADIATELLRLRPQRDFHFLVAGAGPESTGLKARLQRGGLEALFTLLGHVDDVPALLAESDLVVVPSEAEGIPLIALEAFATERPVLCSRVGAAAEVVDTTTGVLVDPGPGEAARFAVALDALLKDPRRRMQMGQAGRRRVEAEYSRERAQQAYRELFAQWTAQI